MPEQLREQIETRIAVNSGQSLARRDELDVEDVIAQVRKIQAVMQQVMKSGEHYGVIPGTGTKPVLLKPGAEKLLLTFRFDPQYESTEVYDGKHLTVKSRCTLYHITSGQRMGSGEGSCSTKESKYAYRQGLRLCPKCGKDAIIKGKKEWGGGWLCFAKKGGCGEKWKDGDPAIEGQSTERVANEDLPDQYNTVLKMANKRSLVAAVLNVTAASDIFTQDLEDVAGHDDTGSERPTKAQNSDARRTASPPQADRGAAPLTERQRMPGDPSRPMGDPDTPERRQEAKDLLPSPADDERTVLLAEIQAAGAKLDKTQRGRIKELFLGSADASLQQADVAALEAILTHLREAK